MGRDIVVSKLQKFKGHYKKKPTFLEGRRIRAFGVVTSLTLQD